MATPQPSQPEPASTPIGPDVCPLVDRPPADLPESFFAVADDAIRIRLRVVGGRAQGAGGS